jgi:hypothetical protein
MLLSLALTTAITLAENNDKAQMSHLSVIKASVELCVNYPDSYACNPRGGKEVLPWTSRS